MANGLFNLKQVVQAVQQGGWPAQKTPAVEYLVVAGGGGSAGDRSGGGGAGGLLQGIDPVPNGQTLLVTVGGGGPGGNNANSGTNGSNSVFGNITSIGGGASTYSPTPGSQPGLAGGSGGGGSLRAGSAGGEGRYGQGNAGGANGVTNTTGWGGGSGGGGAGTMGLKSNDGNAGNGGAGISSAISGTTTVYAGGGGGGAAGPGYQPNVAGAGGIGGGGAGTAATNTAGTAGTANTGGGAGGSGDSGAGAAGGSGIVIVSYPDVYAAPTATTGSPTVSTSGSGSVSFNGTTQALVYTDNAGLTLGTGDFTVECFVYPGSQASSNSTVIGGEGAGAFQLTLTSGTGTPTGVAINAFGTSPFFSQSYAFSQNVWYHIACTRNGTSVRVYVNGVQLGSTTSDSTNFSAGTRAIGAIAGATSQRYAGNVSNVRIVKGTALYTGSTLTVPTAPLTAVSGTSLLLNTVSGAYLADGSTNSLTVSTAYGSPAWNQLSPIATGTGYKNRVYTWTSSGSITF